MSQFLQRVAAHLLKESVPLKDLALVLPSKRASLFLKKELARQLPKPQFAPHITTIEDFVLEALDLEQEEQAVLLFKLFEAYKKSSIPDKEDFKSFMKWGALLLADFNELDRYLVNPKEIFGYLSDVKRIESWNLKPEQHTEMLSGYLAFWEKLPELHQLFSDILLANKKVYQGLAYREVIKHLEKISNSPIVAEHKLYFIGFNALNKAEETLLLHLYNTDKADFLWDIDSYYYKDNLHEAGKFLRQSKLIKQLEADGKLHWLSTNLSEGEKHIEVISAPGNNAQAAVANALLSEIPASEFQQTALVLADETMLTPVLNNLNANVEHLNITMGMPLQSSPLTSFFDLIWQMLVQSEQRSNATYYHKLWNGLLTHPIIKRVYPETQTLETARDQMITERLVYSSLEDLKLPDKLTALLRPVLQKVQTPAENIAAMQALCLSLKPMFSPQEQFVQALYRFYELFGALHKLFSAHTYVDDHKTALQFYRQLLQTESLDLYGEPLQGLQLMGMLETRTLSFKRVIIISLNEDILPAGRSQNSLIPFDIKQKYGLPTYLDKDSVYAYHFYRLLQDAEHISLVYNNQSDGLGGGEASRFIAQLEYELPRVNSKVMFTKRSMQPSVNLGKPEKNIEKTTDVAERLEKMAKRGFSPTALSQYIKNPVEFYYQRVLGVQEMDVLADVIGFDVQGTVIHEILEEFYTHQESKNPWAYIDEAQLEGSLQAFHIRKTVTEKLEAKGVSVLHSGKNLLIKEMLVSMLKHFFEAEVSAIKNYGRIEIEALEMHLKASLPFGDEKIIHFRGIADRVERDNEGVVRIIDYKTGSVNEQKMHISDTEKLDDPDYGKAFQLCLYAYMYLQQHPNEPEVKAGIISLRKTQLWIIPLKWKGKTILTRDFIPEFEAYLIGLFTELFDVSQPFTERKEV